MARHALAPAETLAEPLPYDVRPGTVGKEIAELAEHIEHIESLPDGSYDAEAAGDLHERLLTEVNAFRGELSILTPRHQKLLAPYVPVLLPHQASYPHADTRGQPTVKTLLQLTDADLVYVARRNAAIIERQQKDMAPYINNKKQKFVDDIVSGIADRWMSPWAVNFEEPVLRSEVEVGDW